MSSSFTEAEDRSMATIVYELQGCSIFLQDLYIPDLLPIPLWCDSQPALHISHNLVFHEQTKRLEIDCHLVWEKFLAGCILPQYISSSSQSADILNKSLSSSLFHRMLSKLGLVDSHPPALTCRGCRRYLAGYVQSVSPHMIHALKFFEYCIYRHVSSLLVIVLFFFSFSDLNIIFL